MAQLVSAGDHVVRLGHGDVADLAHLLAGDVVRNVYLRSELRMAPGAGAWWGLRTAAGELRAAVLAGPLTVPCVPDPADAPAMATALIHSGLPRMIVGPREAALGIHHAAHRFRRPRQIRDPQPLLRLDRETAASLARPANAGQVRPATRDDLEPLILAAAAMHREEMGIDPLTVDPHSWRSRMTTLVDRGWSWIWREQGEIVFKAELSAWTPECAQIQGVYVAPRFRRHGVGFTGMAAVIDAVLGDASLCCLYVNSFNDPAQRLYARLGFQRHAEFATILY